ncbi:hypothetical protein NCCP2716_08470 [Sporosarcina sp. NCCP-2716]|uniref:hypothetical protein n=1 Tax=Sporosarcina sp. NCCP-2716 TaxID=2943679 RepID=UPI00203E0DD9|nr:hypothetical protein [Sporosarcina sp. NCCP-2716]GKV68349.1 hypothetical protein NCCP2716_08470 [Sporosarcina sp. NCCP-2716]
MLTFEEKQAIIESYPELTRKEVSMKRVNYHYPDSKFEKTVVVQHLHPNGNAFVYVAGVPGYEPDERGLVNVREASETELRQTIEDAIEGLSATEEEAEPVVEVWLDGHNSKLELKEEQDAWNLYHGHNLEDSFGDYQEAVAYLKEEGFKKVEDGGVIR